MAGRAGVVGGSRAAVFGFAITAVSMASLLTPEAPLIAGAGVVSALIGLVFALTGLGVALGRQRLLLAAPLALGLIAMLTAAGTALAVGRVGLRSSGLYVVAGLVTTSLATASAIGLWRVLPRGVADHVPSPAGEPRHPRL